MLPPPIVCSRCGNVAPAGALACVRCGYPLTVATPPFSAPGPLDAVEWRFHAGWAWFAATVATYVVYCAVRIEQVQSPLLVAFELIGAGVLSWAVLKLRRLYVYQPIPGANYRPTLAVLGSIVVFLILAVEAARFSAERPVQVSAPVEVDYVPTPEQQATADEHARLVQEERQKALDAAARAQQAEAARQAWANDWRNPANQPEPPVQPQGQGQGRN